MPSHSGDVDNVTDDGLNHEVAACVSRVRKEGFWHACLGLSEMAALCYSTTMRVVEVIGSQVCFMTVETFLFLREAHTDIFALIMTCSERAEHAGVPDNEP
ncbi:MAG: hypothetical protein JOY71_12615 [Acetobacteraceae bacterium]|nr:hypothetical protein [Acetobacteraceae bacterium]